jgi:D-psicose/D-tagatose/L-ribulose 3-epimerase
VRTGINLLLWTDEPTREDLLPLYGRLARMGYDGLELPIFGGDPERFRVLGARLADLGLERTATAVCPPEADPIHPDLAVRSAAVAHLQRAIDCAEAAGVRLIGGPLYAAIGKFSGKPPSDAEWEASVGVMQSAADYAARAGITLVFEFLNRFEIYLLNDAARTARFARCVERANVGVHYDTFHAHIEEKDPARAIESAGAAIRHVHVSENDRSTPGQGQVRWAETFSALRRIGYDGWLTIEAFGAALPSLAAATKIWRRLFVDEEVLAREGLAFVRRAWAEAGRERA